WGWRLSMAAKVTVLIPDLGDFKEVDVVDVTVKIGDAVEIDGPLATLETEKATMDVPSTAAGRVVAVHIKKGSKVSAGSPVVDVEPAEGATAAPPRTSVMPPPPPAPAARAAPAAATPPLTPAPAPASAPRPSAAAPAPAPSARVHASPSVRLLARELGVDLAAVAATGPKGRILHGDVKGWVKRALGGGGA